jgi:hypothetical protein
VVPDLELWVQSTLGESGGRKCRTPEAWSPEVDLDR